MRRVLKLRHWFCKRKLSLRLISTCVYKFQGPKAEDMAILQCNCRRFLRAFTKSSIIAKESPFEFSNFVNYTDASALIFSADLQYGENTLFPSHQQNPFSFSKLFAVFHDQLLSIHVNF